MNIHRWAGKVALVTGASSGIGAAIAVELVKKGVIVVGVARRVQLIESLKTGLPGPGKLFALKADVSKENDLLAIFEFIKSEFGTMHILVNNAGIFRIGKLIDQSPLLLKEVVDVNLLGLTYCTQHALKLMKESAVDYGHVIHINSILGHSVSPDGDPVLSIYPATKHAVTALTETLRQELAHLKSKIRVTSISPGLVETEIGFAAAKATGSNKPDPVLMAKFSNRPTLQPKDVADAVVYALAVPPHVQIHELVIKPVGEKI